MLKDNISLLAHAIHMYIYILGIPIHHMGCLYMHSFNCTHVGVLVMISMHIKL